MRFVHFSLLSLTKPNHEWMHKFGFTYSLLVGEKETCVRLLKNEIMPHSLCVSLLHNTRKPSRKVEKAKKTPRKKMVIVVKTNCLEPENRPFEGN